MAMSKEFIDRFKFFCVAQLHIYTSQVDYYDLGSQSERISFALCDNWLGKFTSNSIIKSPLLEFCLGCNNPSPWILLTEFGLITSVSRNGILLPSIVGICKVAPHKDWNKIRNVKICTYKYANYPFS